MSGLRNQTEMFGEHHVSGSDRWQRLAFWFLFLSYAIGAPIFAIIEAKAALMSARFDYPPLFIYAVSASQFACAIALFFRATAPWSLAILTVLSMGAMYSHFRIDSPLTSLPALVYTLVQIWYGVRLYWRA